MNGPPPPPAASNSPSGDNHVPPARPPHIQDYELLRRIGSGSYGDVWLARNVLGQFRAVKIIYRHRFADPRPFEREFEGIQRFEPISRSHPSQLHILHVGKNDADGCFYYVMELADQAEPPRVDSGSELMVDSGVKGTSLAHPMGEGRGEGKNSQPSTLDAINYLPHTLRHDLERHSRLPIPDCVQIGLSLATALAHLHEQGLVHRDIKPSNIIFVNGVAKLGDIGLVTEAGDTQSIVGTEGYLPPEGPGTPQADLYSLGKVLYEISTGMDRRRFAALPEESWNWPDRDQLMEFNEIVLKACARDPAQRYKTADELRADLELVTSGRSVKKARSRERGWLLARRASVAAVLIGIAVGSVKLLNRVVPPEVAEGGPPSTNELANALCDKALRSLRADAHGEFPGIYTNFHHAIELDPHFARPYVGLLELVAREWLPGVTYLPEDDQRALTRRLVKLAPECAAARCAEATIAYYDFDFLTAEREARRAIQICPDSEFIHTTYAFFLLMWGRTVDARRQLEISKGLNSSKVQVHRMLAHTYFIERNFPRAIEISCQAIAWERRDLPSYDCLERAYLASGEYEKAIDVSESLENLKRGPTPEAAARFARLRQAFRQDRGPGYWQELLNQTPKDWLYDRARILAHLDKIEEAFDLLNQAYESEKRSRPLGPDMQMLVLDEVWEHFRHDPRFQALLDKIGFTKVNPKLKE